MSEERKVTPEKSLIPYEVRLIEQARNYCDLMKFPEVAISAVLSTLSMYNNLKDIIEKQRRLPDEQRALLIDTKTRLAAPVLKIIDDFVERHGIPYDAMTWVEGKPYPKADGLRYKLAADPRVLKTNVTIPIEAPSLNDNVIVGRECTIEFWNGQKFTRTGFADLNEIQARRAHSQASPGFMAMIAETRSERRCALKALGLPTGVAEEVIEAKEYEEATKETVVAPKASATMPGVPTNKAELLAMAQKQLSLGAAGVLRKLGKGSLSEITDFTKAWEILKGGQT